MASWGAAAPTQQDNKNETDAVGGFYVEITGRMLYGTTKPEAVTFLETEYLPRIKEMGRRKGLGFHVLDEARPTESKANKPVLSPSRYYTNIDDLRFSAIRGVAQDTEDVPEEFKDPITEEDMRGDWRFDLIFKIKLGDMPETKDAEGKKNE